MRWPDFRLDKSDKRKVVFVRNVAGVFTEIRRVKVDETSVQVAIKKRKMNFVFDISKPSFRRKNTFYYYVDIESGQLYLNEPSKNQLVSPELLDAILVRQIAKQLVSSLESKPMIESIIMIILGIVAGMGLGYILGNFLPIP